MLKNKKGQTSLEIILVILFLLFFIVYYLYPQAESTIKSGTDFNDLALARYSGKIIASAVGEVSISAPGVKKDIAIHIPFDTTDIQCSGDIITFYIRLWNEEPAVQSYTTNNITQVTTRLPAKLSSDCSKELCPAKSQLRSAVWGPGIEFCTTAGFNMNLYVEKVLEGNQSAIYIKDRRYWALTEWKLT